MFKLLFTNITIKSNYIYTRSEKFGAGKKVCIFAKFAPYILVERNYKHFDAKYKHLNLHVFATLVSAEQPIRVQC